jgi:hypothetical protein
MFIKLISFAYLLIIMCKFGIIAQQCNDYVIEKNGNPVFTISSANDSCICKSFIGDGSGLTNLQNQIIIANLTAQLNNLKNLNVICRVKSNEYQTITNGVIIKLQYNLIDIDTHNGWSISNSEYVIPISGYYRITGHMLYDLTTGIGNFEFLVIINNTRIYGGGLNTKYSSQNTNIGIALPGITILLNLGDQINLSVVQGSGTNVITNGDPTFNWFDIIRII